MALTPAQLKGRIKNIAAKNNADARLLMRIYMMDRFPERLANHQLEKLAGSTELQKLWRQYQAKFAYAADINFENVMGSINALAQKAGIL